MAADRSDEIPSSLFKWYPTRSKSLSQGPQARARLTLVILARSRTAGEWRGPRWPRPVHRKEVAIAALRSADRPSGPGKSGPLALQSRVRSRKPQVDSGRWANSASPAISRFKAADRGAVSAFSSSWRLKPPTTWSIRLSTRCPWPPQADLYGGNRWYSGRFVVALSSGSKSLTVLIELPVENLLEQTGEPRLRLAALNRLA